jgi:hypothetical protein
MTMAQVMKDIKVRSNNRTKLLVYLDVGEIGKGSASGTDAAREIWAAESANQWFLYADGLNHSGPVDSWWDPPNFVKVNYTTFVPRTNGKNAMEWFTDYSLGFIRNGQSTFGVSNEINPSVDGLFMDNFFWHERVDGDWNLDGNIDHPDDPQVPQWIQSGYKAYVDYTRGKWPGSTQTGNIADWGDEKSDLTIYDQLLDGGVMEGMLGEVWSTESWGSFEMMMAAYRKMIDHLRPPKFAIFGHNNLAPDDYRTMRYGLTATLMDDGYYYPSGTNGYSPADQFWFDEFDQNLGTATQPRQSKAWSQGVWRRDFEHGMALCNPKGNGARTVSLGGTFRKFTGKQDSAANDGSTVTDVTLEDRDGIILLR